MQSVSLAFARALINSISNFDKRILLRLENYVLSHGVEQLPMSELSQLFELAIRHSGNEDLGLLAYKSAHPGHLGVLGYAVMSSSTLGEAMARMVDHHSIIGTGFCMFFEGDETTVRIAGLSGNAQGEVLPRAFIDAVAAITLGLLRWLVPTVCITPVRAEFAYERPRDTRQLEQIFGHDLRFSCAANAMVFQKSDMDIAIATSDASLQQIHDQYLKRRLDEMRSENIAAATKKVILQHLVQARSLAMGDIVLTLGMSTHQLIRALEKENKSFQLLVDQVKKQHCYHLLVNTRLTLKQVSYSLGFRHSSALNKACERWFGMAPGACRSREKM